MSEKRPGPSWRPRGRAPGEAAGGRRPGEGAGEGRGLLTSDSRSNGTWNLVAWSGARLEVVVQEEDQR
uniref:Uncharacterized protein n=1 Tax=Arundo donax TaxID=35708 RepID=A0A0A9FNP2_ARUDO